MRAAESRSNKQTVTKVTGIRPSRADQQRQKQGATALLHQLEVAKTGEGPRSVGEYVRV